MANEPVGGGGVTLAPGPPPKPPAPPQPKKPVAPGTAPPVSTGTQDQNNAQADLQQILGQYGLASLASWAWGEIVAGKSEDQVLVDLQNTKQFKDRFPAIAIRAANGLPAISPGDYVTFENNATQIMRAAGLPEGFWDSPADFTNLIAADVSTSELQNRVQLAQQAVYQSPPDVQAILQRDYGMTPGDLAASFLDPGQAEPLLQQKLLAAQIGGAADTTGYGSGKGMDDYLAQLGVTQAQATAGFNDLSEKGQLFNALPGEAGGAISQDTQIGAEFGQNSQDQQAISQRAQARQAAFKQGGSFVSGTGGFSGIGNAGTQ